MSGLPVTVSVRWASRAPLTSRGGGSEGRLVLRMRRGRSEHVRDWRHRVAPPRVGKFMRRDIQSLPGSVPSGHAEVRTSSIWRHRLLGSSASSQGCKEGARGRRIAKIRPTAYVIVIDSEDASIGCLATFRTLLRWGTGSYYGFPCGLAPWLASFLFLRALRVLGGEAFNSPKRGQAEYLRW